MATGKGHAHPNRVRFYNTAQTRGRFASFFHDIPRVSAETGPNKAFFTPETTPLFGAKICGKFTGWRISACTPRDTQVKGLKFINPFIQLSSAVGVKKIETSRQQFAFPALPAPLVNAFLFPVPRRDI